MNGVFVTGTDTGVGKTVVAAGIARLLADRGIDVGVMKPVETGHASSSGPWPEDARMLADAARVEDERDLVVPFIYDEPLAPLIAARRAGRPIDPGTLDGAARTLERRHDLLIVEGAGGVSVPLTDDLDMAGLATRWRLPILVVVRPTLGTLNHTFLTVQYARSQGGEVLGLVICGSNPPSTADVAERTNPDALAELCRTAVLGVVPRTPEIHSAEGAATAVAAGLNPDAVLDAIASGAAVRR